MTWLASLGQEKTQWLNDVVLLYKERGELQCDTQSALSDQGFELRAGVVRYKQELSEYEMCFEQLGLPRHFGRKRRRQEWIISSG